MKKVLLLLCQGFEASVFTDVLGWSRSYGLEGVAVETVALGPEIQCIFNLIVRPQKRMEDIEVSEFDALAIPGGFEENGFYEDAYDQRVSDLIRRFDTEDKYIASICVAALALGKSGILKGKKATSYHMNGGVRRRQLAEFDVDVQDHHLQLPRSGHRCRLPAPRGTDFRSEHAKSKRGYGILAEPVRRLMLPQTGERSIEPYFVAPG